MSRSNAQVDGYIDALEDSSKDLARDVRKQIFDAAPEATEDFKWSRPVYALERPFCYFQVAKKHLALGFHEGATLNDPEGLLEGTGKAMRHVKVGLDQPKLSKEVVLLLKRAAASAASK